MNLDEIIKHKVELALSLPGNKTGRQQAEDLLKLCKTARPIAELMKKFEWRNRTKFRKKFINPLIEMNLIAMTIPDKPNSSQQKYIITENGRELLNSI